MPLDKEWMEAIRLQIKTLVFLEIRLFRTGQASPPGIVRDEISHSIDETKKEVVRLTRTMDGHKKRSLLKKVVQQAVDEEIERAIRLRKNKCLRCIHGRFYDRFGTAFETLPRNATLAQAIGCDRLRPSLRKTCKRFVETVAAQSLEDYLDEMAFLYEFREMVDRMEEIWKDYLTI